MADSNSVSPAATMNPERVRMLQEAAREEASRGPEIIKIEDSPPPPVTGANCASVNKEGPQNAAGSSLPAKPLSQEELPVLLGRPDARALAAIFGVEKDKTSGKIKKNKMTKAQKKARRLAQELRAPLSLGRTPPENENTRHLRSLLKHRGLKITISPANGQGTADSGPKVLNLRISDVGLFRHEEILRLSFAKGPSLIHDRVSGVSESIKFSIQGMLLEDIWSTLSARQKQSYATQLGQIVRQLRQYSSRQAQKLPMGSFTMNGHALLLDNRVENTYYGIRYSPTHKDFVGFLASSFIDGVPHNVQASLVMQMSNFDDGKKVLSHGALSPGHIVVHNHQIQCILRWDCSGFYPTWWEYVKFFEARTDKANNDWYDYAKYIFEEEFPTQLAAYQGFRRCQDP